MPLAVNNCPLCLGRKDRAAIKEHNLRCAEYGERVYLGRDDPRLPVKRHLEPRRA